jgi:hypothetical protein
VLRLKQGPVTIQIAGSPSETVKVIVHAELGLIASFVLRDGHRFLVFGHEARPPKRALDVLAEPIRGVRLAMR